MAILNTPFRNMANIKDRPSSARILNLLHQTPKIKQQIDDQDFEPFFINDSLNHGIFLKHRMRGDEMEIFDGKRSVGTKIFSAFNPERLEEGGKYIFVDERDAEEIFHENFGMDKHVSPEDVAHDIALLRILDSLPSLDPFLLREKLRLEGYHPHVAYFDLNKAEYQQIRNFVEREFTPLAEIAFEEEDHTSTEQIERLVDKMWDSRDIDAIRPLIHSLQIEPKDAPEVLFAWKGFIYYKSNLGIVKQQFHAFQSRVQHLKIGHLNDKGIEMQINDLRQSTILGMKRELAEIQKTIAIYEVAYKKGLLRERNPKAFRRFLDEAPSMFYDLGASIAAIKHAVSFWDFRFGPDHGQNCDADEFLDIMNDFRRGLRPNSLTEEEAA